MKYKNICQNDKITKWISNVAAIGIVSKAGRYGGTYAHSDIAFEFASWISAVKEVKPMDNYGEIIIYQSDDGLASIEVKVHFKVGFGGVYEKGKISYCSDPG